MCHGNNCSSGKFFHLNCLSCKRCLNNYKLSWLCNDCKLESIVAKKSSKPSKESSLSASNISDNTDIVCLGETYNADGEKYGVIATLSVHDLDVIETPNGWLENTIIQYAQALLQTVNPALQRFQWTSLRAYLNFGKVDGDFVQILHTGGNRWVCVSSIGCEKGFVNLYGSLFHDVILDDLEQQVRNLTGEQQSNGSAQQQSNGSACGVFAIAFATVLVYNLDKNIEFNVHLMRTHPSTCLKNRLITPFPVIEQLDM